MKRILFVSLLVNLFLFGLIAWSVTKLGGFRYTWQRIRQPGYGIYNHRVQHFAKLPERTGSIIFLGDSEISQAEWHEIFGDTPPVLNRGIAGDYISGVEKRLTEVLRHKPLKIFLLVGVNDLIAREKIEAMENNYRKIVQRIRGESPNTELFLLSLLPVNKEVRDFGLDNKPVQAFNERIRQIAHDFALQYLDLNTPLTDADGNLAVKFTDDGLHINGLGYVVVKNELEKVMWDE